MGDKIAVIRYYQDSVLLNPPLNPKPLNHRRTCMMQSFRVFRVLSLLGLAQ